MTATYRKNTSPFAPNTWVVEGDGPDIVVHSEDEAQALVQERMEANDDDAAAEE